MTTEVTPDGKSAGPEHKQADTTPKDLAEAMALIENLKGINKEVISGRDKANQKLRHFETEQETREQALLAEQGKYKELYEKRESELSSLKTTLKNKAVDSVLREALQRAGARSVDTVAKLIDKSKIAVSDENSDVDAATVLLQIEELKKTDPILFSVGEGNLPPVKRPSDGVPSAGYEQDLRAAKTQNEITAVMKKYGKI